MPGELFFLPRFWFYRDGHPTLIQIQRNAFMVNWRRLATPPGEYPHYELVVRDFWREFESYRTFVQDDVGGKLDLVERCELTYVNAITRNELFSGPSDVVGVLPLLASLAGVQNEERRLAGLNSTTTYAMTDGVLVDLRVQLGVRSEAKEPALGLELKAYGAPTGHSLEGARAWYDAAHDATYRLFLDATAKGMQERVWKPK